MKINLPGIIITSVAGIMIANMMKPKNYLNKIKILEGNIHFDKDKIKAASWQVIFYTIDLPVINPLDFDIKTEGMFIETHLNGILVGNANTTKVYTLPKKSTTIIPITIAKDISQLPGLVYDSITSIFNNKSMVMLVSGKINFAPGVVKFTYQKGVSI